MNIDYNAVIEILKSFLENEKTEILGISVGEERQVRDAIKNLLTAYEKEKEKNKELSSSYDKLAKECNEENRRCMLLAVENQDLKEGYKIQEHNYQVAMEEIEQRWEDKIIAKVIEIKDRPVKDEFITATQGRLNTIIDIESLLNKEE